MRRWLWRWGRNLGLVALGALAAIVIGRAVQSLGGPDLAPWHTAVPDEPRALALDATDWPGWLAAEARLFDQAQREVTPNIPAASQLPGNRYWPGSPNHPARFTRDWNRSYVLEPDGPARGAVVLLHGLTDAPYSMRHIAEHYRGLGFIALAPRMPGHGTVPAGLTRAVWEDWAAATRLAMREARRRAGPELPVHIVGYSNGGALALRHALEAIENPGVVRPARIVLLSPMIGVSAFARLAGLAAWPALLPAFANAAWLSVLPEFNPFKYNSFPAQAALQTHRLTGVLQAQIARLSADGRLAGLAPVLAFQSVLDSTVLTQALIDRLFGLLPANGSHLVLFDRNRATPLAALMRPGLAAPPETLLPAAPRRYRLSVIGNTEASSAAQERLTEAGTAAQLLRPLGIDYPADLYSLSHVALPFAVDDPLYGVAGGVAGGPAEFGIRLGAVAAHGEMGALLVGPETFQRASWNPFLPWLLDQLTEGLGRP